MRLTNLTVEKVQGRNPIRLVCLCWSRSGDPPAAGKFRLKGMSYGPVGIVLSKRFCVCVEAQGTRQKKSNAGRDAKRYTDGHHPRRADMGGKITTRL